MIKYLVALLLAFLLFLPNHSVGQSSGLHFLNVGPNTRALALGEAVTTLPMGGSSIYTNPANLVQDTTSSMTADYTLWVAGLNNSHVAVNLHNKPNQAIAFGLLNSGSDNFEARTTPGPSQGTFSVNYLSVSGAYGRAFNNISVGMAIHYIREEFLVNEASGYSFNFGLSSHWLDQRLRVGASLLSIGEMNKLRNVATQLPTNLRVGMSGELFRFVPPKNRDLPMLITLYGDYVYLWEEQLQTTSQNLLNFGISVTAAELLEFRGGYKTGNTDRKFSVGIGVDTPAFSFNYSLIPFETGFGTAHSVGIEYYF